MSVFKLYKGKRITSKHPKYADARWWVYKRVKGHKTIHKAIPEARTKEQAELAERQMIDDLFNRKYGVADSETTFTDFADKKYWPYVEQHNTNITAKRQYVGILKKHFQRQPIAVISPQDCRDLQWTLGRGTLAPASVNRIMSTLSKIFTLACEEGILDRNPMHYVRTLKEPPPRNKLLTNEERERLWDCLMKDQLMMRLVTLAVHLPLRRGQLLSIAPEAIDWSASLLIATASKGRPPRIIPLNDTAINTLKVMLADGQLPFPLKDIRKRWTRILTDAEINKKDSKRGENFTFHDLRHEMASELIRRNVNPEIVRKLYGHSDMSITQIYMNADFDMLSNALKTLDATNVQPSIEIDGPPN